MKKKLFVFLISLFIITFSSCFDNQLSSSPISHTHKFDEGELVIDNDNYLEKMVYECECGEIKEEITHQHTFEETYSYTEKTHYKMSNCEHPIMAFIETHTLLETGKCEKCDYVNQKIYEEYAKYNLPIEVNKQYSWLSTLDINEVLEIQIVQNGILNYSSNKSSIKEVFDAVCCSKLYPLNKEEQDSVSIKTKSINIIFITNNQGYSLSLCDNNNIIKLNDVYYTCDFKYELDDTYKEGSYLYTGNNSFRFKLDDGAVFVNDVYKEEIQTNLYNYIIVNKLEQEKVYYEKNNLYIKVKSGKKVSIIDSTTIIVNSIDVYELVGQISFEVFYNKYHNETKSATLTIIDSLNDNVIAEIIYSVGKIIDNLGMSNFGFKIEYEDSFYSRYLYEDETLTNKLTSLTMNEDKTIYLGYIEIGDNKFKEIYYETLMHNWQITSAENWYTTITYSGLSSYTPLIPNATLLTSYEDLLNTEFAYAADTVFNKELFTDYNILVLCRSAAASNFIARLYNNLVINDGSITLDYICPHQYYAGLTAVYYCQDFILIPKDITYNVEDIEMIYLNNLADIFAQLQ